MNSLSFFEILGSTYNQFHYSAIDVNRFGHGTLMNALNEFGESDQIRKTMIGNSVEGREIYALEAGSGPKRVLLWSQMHGNESTATRALLDIFGLISNPKSLKEQIDYLLKELTIRFIPMLNPDGAERFERRNALGVDMNRDALMLQSPESRLLKHEIDNFKPHVGYNLHDQRRFYNVIGTSKPSTISFLAPAYNVEKDINESREISMKLIVGMNKCLQTVIPGQVGLYNDSFYVRAFGDNIQKWGVSTILLESGWAHNDMEKEQVRKLNYQVIMSSMFELANGAHMSHSIKDYQSMPMNDNKLFDVLLKNVQIKRHDTVCKVDLGIRREEMTVYGTSSYWTKGIVEDIGDLSINYGFEEPEVGDLIAKRGRIYPEVLNSVEDLEKLDIQSLLKESILYIEVSSIDKNYQNPYPINIFQSGQKCRTQLHFETDANFILTNADGGIHSIVLNGFFVHFDEEFKAEVKGRVYM